MAFAVRGLSPVIMTVRIPIARSSAKRSLMPSLITSLRWTTPSARAVLGHDERRPARGGDAVDGGAELRRDAAALLLDPAADRVGGALADAAAVDFDAAHARLRGERDELGAVQLAAAQVVSLLREHDDRATLRRLVGEARELRRVGELDARSTPGAGMKSVAWRLPSVIVPVLSSSSVEQSPAASTARPLMASTLRWTSRSMPAMPIAESSAPIVVGMRQTSSAMSTITGCSAPRVDGVRLQRDRREQEDDREARRAGCRARSRSASSGGSRPRRGRSSGRGSVSPGSRVTRTTISSESTRVPPVTAERSPPDSRMTGADSPVIADSSTLAMPSTTSPSAGMISPAVTTHLVADVRACELGTLLDRPVGQPSARRRLGARLAQRVGLGLAASLGHRLGEVREEDGEPEPGGDAAGEDVRLRGRVAEILERRGSWRGRLPSSVTNMTGLRAMRRGLSLRTLSSAGAVRRSSGRRWTRLACS